MKLSDIIINTIDDNINKFKFDKDTHKKIEEVMKSNKKYNYFVLKITIKNGVATPNNLKHDTRKEKILKLINKSLKFAKEHNKEIPDTEFYIYVTDVQAYEYPDLPFWVLAKPKNDPGILFPDDTFEWHLLNDKKYNWDETKKIIINKCKDVEKSNKIFFKGANTGADKTNLRMLLHNSSESMNIPIDIILDKPKDPLYSFCKNKYLLNLPGHQPWSYRFKYLFLMKSLVIDIIVTKKYSGKKNERWMNFFDYWFEPNIDYIPIEYEWGKVFDEDEYQKLIKNIEKTYKYYEKNPNSYKKIVDSGFKKASAITQDVVYASIYALIIKYTEKIKEAKII